MKVSDQLNVLSQLINFSIFLFFSIKLIKTNSLSLTDLILSGIGLLGGLIVSVIAQIERIIED